MSPQLETTIDQLSQVACKEDIFSPLDVTVYCFEKATLAIHPDLSKTLVDYCSWVQDQVWDRKHPADQNSVSQDILFFVWDKNKQQPAAFFSSALYDLQPGHAYIYISDSMVLPTYRKNGLLRYYIETMNRLVRQKFPTRKILNVVTSGYIHHFTPYEKSDYFSRIEPPYTSEKFSIARQLSQEDFEGLEMDNDGIIRGGWNPQSNDMKEVWPDTIADEYEFPRGIDYFSGDVLVRVYSYLKL